MAYKASKSYGSGGERRGNVNFRVHMDDRQLMSKLKRLGAEGQDELRKLINEMMQKARVQSQEFLLDQKIHDRGTRGPTARSVQNVMTPKGDKNVYVQIANSLKISDDVSYWPKSGDMRDKQHPGFKKVDFLEPAQKYMEDNFEKEAKKLVEKLMR